VNAMSNPSNGNLPPTLWRLTRFSLTAVVVIGVLLTLSLALGMADPPTAGPLAWEVASPTAAIIAPRQTSVMSEPLELQVPFTLDVTAQFSFASDPTASWGLIFQDNNHLPVFGILVNGNSFFSVIPAQPDFTPFIHIRPPGESNKLTLNVEADNHATLRINDEIAWQGKIPSPQRATIQAIGGTAKIAIVTLQRQALHLSHN
jgi:hypothetical protein